MSHSDLWVHAGPALIEFSFFVLLMAIGVLGYRAGLKQRAKQQVEKSDLILQCLITLLALLLAFSISMAEIRYEERNSIFIEEATTIETTYLRTALFSGLFQKKMQPLLKHYVDLRIERFQLHGDPILLGANLKKTAELQSALWSEAAAMARAKPLVTASLLLTSLNQAIDLQAKQEFAFMRRIPMSIIVLVLLISVFVAFLVSYGLALTGSRNVVGTSMMALVLSMTLFVISDLNRAEEGWIQINPQVLIDLRHRLDQPR